MTRVVWIVWLTAIVGMSAYLFYRQLQCIDCTRMRIIADSWPVYAAILILSIVVYLIFRFTEKK